MLTNDQSVTVVVTTLGRAEALTRLFSSLETQLRTEDTLVVVAQGNVDQVTELTSSIKTAAEVICTTSERGATRGRNAGVAATKRGDVLIFPNDTTWYPPGSIDEIRSQTIEDFTVFTVRDEAGAKFVFTERIEPFTYRTVWDVIEPGFAVKRSAFEAIGGFDESIGTGAQSPWQAGEVADLLYRWAFRASNKFVRWAPSIVVGGVTDSTGLNKVERRRKLRAYGRGCGRIMSIYRAPLWFRTAYIVAGLLISIKRPGLYSFGDGWSAMVGRFEGVTGRIWGGEFRAVSR